MPPFAAVFVDVLLPVLLIVALGASLRARMPLDLPTLSKVNLHLLTPAFIFDRVAHSTLGWGEMGGVLAASVAQVVILGLVVWGLGRAGRAERQAVAAAALCTMFYNSGNVGLPLAELAFPAGGPRGSGGTPQAFVALTQNVLVYTVGLAIGSAFMGVIADEGDRVTARQIARRILAMPVIYTLVAALVARAYLGAGYELPAFVDKTTRYVAGGLVPVALFLLGAQLAHRPRWPRWRPVALVATLRLIVAPALMAAMLYGLHRAFPGSWLDLWPWPAQVLVFTAAVPTAVNTLIVTMELGGDVDLVADCVFWTTLLSSVTLVGWLLVARSIG